jgi:hypothetical protein
MPSVPYVSADDLQTYLGATSLVDDDAVRACAAASRWVDQWTGRTFELASEPSARLFQVTDPHRIWLDDIADPAVTVSEGAGYSSDWAADEFLLDPPQPAQGWPYTSIRTAGARSFLFTSPGLVQVTATWGWPAVPDDVKMATLIQAARLYKRRESPDGTLGGGDFGIVRVGRSIDPDVQLLLEPYQLVVVGIA